MKKKNLLQSHVLISNNFFKKIKFSINSYLNIKYTFYYFFCNLFINSRIFLYLNKKNTLQTYLNKHSAIFFLNFNYFIYLKLKILYSYLLKLFIFCVFK